MGPDATVDFMAKVIKRTPAERDQDHLHMLVDHNPRVPNRQTAILAGGEDPGPELAAMARRLEAAGADFLVIPCNTAYVFKDAIVNAVQIPLISIIDLSARAAIESGATTVGVIATDGCVAAGIYQDALEQMGAKAVTQTDAEIAEFMQLCTQIKAGYQGEKISRAMAALAQALVDRGAEAIIAGCTEIPLVLEQPAVNATLISSTDVLAEETVRLGSGEQPLPTAGS